MRCRVCDGLRLERVVDLGEQPWCNHFLRPEQAGTEPYYPLRVVCCVDCRTAQLDFTVDKKILFGDHTYLSGVTRTLDAHFAAVAGEVDERFFRDRKNRSVLDIGSNDGTQLVHYQSLGYSILGVESSETTAAIANSRGIDTLHAFFNEETAKSLGRKFDVINAAGVFFHLEELHSAAEGIRLCLADDGVFVVQFLYMKKILENLAFDQIYHEHLLYYNLETLEALLSRHGLALFDCRLSPIHGGSVIGFVAQSGREERSGRMQELLARERESGANEIEAYRRFARAVERKKTRELEYLKGCKREGKKIFGLGAPVKGNTLLNYYGIGTDILDCLVEKNRLRKGLVSPGMHIPIVLEEDLEEQPDVYYVLAWNFKEEILSRNRALLDAGVKFHFPIEPEAA